MSVGCIIHGGSKSSSIGDRTYYNWRGQMLWQHAYNTAREITNEIVVVGVDIEIERTRQKTINKALQMIKSNRVIIFDLSTPLVTGKHLKALENTEAKSATFALPVNTGVYNSDSKMHCDSAHLFLVQGPQIFDTNLLKDAYKKTSLVHTQEDTCIIKEVHGIEPLILPGNSDFLFEFQSQRDMKVIDALAI